MSRLRGDIEATVPELAREVAVALRPWPVEVFYGRERFSQQIVTKNKIQIEEVGQDTWGPPAGSRDGVRPSVGTCLVAVQVLIEGKSERAGAGDADHRRLVRHLARLVFALTVEKLTSWSEDGTGRAQPLAGWAATGGFVEVPEDELEVGARYVLSFRVSTSVMRAADMLKVDASTLGLSGTTKVTVNGEEQVVCGP